MLSKNLNILDNVMVELLCIVYRNRQKRSIRCTLRDSEEGKIRGKNFGFDFSFLGLFKTGRHFIALAGL